MATKKKPVKKAAAKKVVAKKKPTRNSSRTRGTRSKKERVRPLSEFRADAESYCASASEATRRLAFSGLAVIWIFRDAGNKNHISDEFLFPAVLFVSAIALDFLQYAISAMIWTIFVRFHETRSKDDSKKVDGSVLLPLPSYIFFWIKLGVVAIAYAQLIPQLWNLQK